MLDIYYFYLFVFIICYHCLMMNKAVYNIYQRHLWARLIIQFTQCRPIWIIVCR